MVPSPKKLIMTVAVDHMIHSVHNNFELPCFFASVSLCVSVFTVSLSLHRTVLRPRRIHLH